MPALIANVAKGRIAYYASLPAANDNLIWVVFKAAGLESDAVLQDKTSLADVISGTTDEADFGGYSRKQASSVTVTVDHANDRVDIDLDDPMWSPTSSQALGKIGVFYDPDTTAGTDADLIPLFFDDFVFTTPSAGEIFYTVPDDGIMRAA